MVRLFSVDTNAALRHTLVMENTMASGREVKRLRSLRISYSDGCSITRENREDRITRMERGDLDPRFAAVSPERRTEIEQHANAVERAVAIGLDDANSRLQAGWVKITVDGDTGAVTSMRYASKVAGAVMMLDVEPAERAAVSARIAEGR